MFDLEYYNLIIDMTRKLEEMKENCKSIGMKNNRKGNKHTRKLEMEALYQESLRNIELWEGLDLLDYQKWYSTYFNDKQDRYDDKMEKRFKNESLLEKQDEYLNKK